VAKGINAADRIGSVRMRMDRTACKCNFQELSRLYLAKRRACA
jgi:hypothetical protein